MEVKDLGELRNNPYVQIGNDEEFESGSVVRTSVEAVVVAKTYKT